MVIEKYGSIYLPGSAVYFLHPGMIYGKQREEIKYFSGCVMGETHPHSKRP